MDVPLDVQYDTKEVAENFLERIDALQDIGSDDAEAEATEEFRAMYAPRMVNFEGFWQKVMSHTH